MIEADFIEGFTLSEALNHQIIYPFPFKIS